MNKLKLEDFLNYKYLSNLNYSPNKKQVAFVINKANHKDNNYTSNIYVLEGKKPVKLTSTNKESFYVWTDDQTLLYASNKNENDKKYVEAGNVQTTFYTLDIQSKKSKLAFKLPLFVSELKVLGNDKYLIKTTLNNKHLDYYKYSKKEKKAYLQEKSDNKNYEVIEQIPWWFNGAGYTYDTITTLFVYDAKKDLLTPIIDKAIDVSSITLSEDKKQVIFTGGPLSNKPILYSKVYKYDFKTKETTTLYDRLDYMIYSAYFKEDNYLVVANDGIEYGLNQNPSFYTLDNQQDLDLACFYDRSIGSSVGCDSRYGANIQTRYYKDEYYFVTTIRNSAHLYKLNKDNQIEKLIEIEGSIESFDINGNKVILIGLFEQKLQEVYEYDLETSTLNQITKLNTKVLKDKYVAIPELLNFKSRDTDIDGWVLKPYNYKEGKKYPAILNIHGGPKTVYGEVFFHEMQYWASLGYFVFFSNPVGGDGRGNEFLDIRGKYGSIDYEDLMNFTDEVIKKYPAIDTENIAVTGGSYGGFMTNWIVGHTNRFKVAATQRCISNWMSFYGTTDIGTYFARDQLAVKDPIKEADKMWDLSPLKYANEIQTPMLFIHSDEDFRCWVPEAMQLYTAVKDNGIDSKMVIFHGENHELSRAGRPQSRIKRLEQITKWIQKYTK